MDKYALFTLLWTNLAVPIDPASAKLAAALMAQIEPWFKLCVGAFLLVSMMIAAWSPHETGAIDKMFRNFFLAAIVYSIAFNVPTFDYYVTALVHGTVNKISVATTAIFNHGDPVNSNAFDIIGTRSFAVGLAVFKNIPFNPVKAVPLGMAVTVYWYLSYCAIVVMFSIYIVSYVLGAFIMAFGPLFIPLYFFPFTRSFFNGWLSCVLATVLVQIFTAALAAMFIFVIGLILNLAATGLNGSELGNVDGGVVVGEIMMLVATALFCCIFAVLSGVMVYVAMRITGGAHAGLGRVHAPSWMPSFGGGGGGEREGAGAGAGSGGHSGSGGPGDGHGGSSEGGGRQADAAIPNRDYAFNRNVGSAL